MVVHAEIIYVRENGESVHSDICPSMCLFENLNEKHIKYLHDCLDEWLNNSRGTGIFYIKNENFEIDSDKC